MKSLRKQRGMGMLAWLLVLIIAGFFMLCAFKIIPMYAENRYVVAGLKVLVEPGSTLEEMTTAEIKAKMDKFYTINGVRTKGPQNIVVERDAKRVIVKIDYETRENLFSNVDVVVSFKNHLDSTNLSQCCTPVGEK